MHPSDLRSVLRWCRRRRLTAAACALMLAGCAAPGGVAPPDCPSDAQVAAMAQRFVALQPEPDPPTTLTLAGAVCGRDRLVKALQATQGPVIGYKAALTNPAVQQRFGWSSPIRGALFERSIVPDGAEVRADYGQRPVFEADLVVEVGSTAIHDATTPEQVLASLRSIHPFIELADLVAVNPERLGGPGITLINAGARYGVLGAPIPIGRDPKLADALRDMTVRVLDGTGRELDTGRGTAILGHPLNAVIWLAADLRRAGIVLKPGDLLSLGAFSRPRVPQVGQDVRVIYHGLPGTPAASVRFR